MVCWKRKECLSGCRWTWHACASFVRSVFGITQYHCRCDDVPHSLEVFICFFSEEDVWMIRPCHFSQSICFAWILLVWSNEWNVEKVYTSLLILSLLECFYGCNMNVFKMFISRHWDFRLQEQSCMWQQGGFRVVTFWHRRVVEGCLE